MEGLGSWYLEGMTDESGNRILEKSARKAICWLKKAAELDHPLAIFQLGCCYGEGLGVKKNVSRELECYRKAARLGELLPLSNLAAVYKLRGNSRQYRYWLERAAEAEFRNGAYLAEGILELARLRFTKRSSHANRRNSVRQLRRTAVKAWNLVDRNEAMTLLAMAYEKGLGVRPSQKIAKRWSNPTPV